MIVWCLTEHQGHHCSLTQSFVYNSSEAFSTRYNKSSSKLATLILGLVKNLSGIGPFPIMIRKTTLLTPRPHKNGVLHGFFLF